MPEPKNDLRDMSFDFLSLVTAPDNPEANIVLLKARPESTDTRNPGEDDDNVSVESMSGKQPQSTAAAPPDGGDATAQDLTKEAIEAILKQNALLKERNELLEAQNEAIVKAVTGDEDDFEDDEDDEDDVDDDDDAPVTKGRDDEDLIKNHPAFRAMQAEMAKMAKALDETSAVAKAAEDARVTEVLKGRAAELKALGEVDEVAGVLRKAFDALDIEAYREVEGLLAKAARIAAEGDVFKEAGTATTPKASSKIEELLEKSAAPGDDGLTVAQRLRKQFVDNPGLYAEIQADDSNNIGRAL